MTDSECSFKFELFFSGLLKKMFKIQLKEFGSVVMVKLYAHKSNPALISTDSGKTDRLLNRYDLVYESS